MPSPVAQRYTLCTSQAWDCAKRRVLLRMIAGAQRRGLDVTTEAYPYTAAMTDLGSAVFEEGWQTRNGDITFGSLQWAATGERLTAESFVRYRKQGGMVIIHEIPEEIARLAIADPSVMVASDGQIEHGQGPSSGCGNLRPRSRTLRSGRTRSNAHGCAAQDELNAGPAAWNPIQGSTTGRS